MIENLHNTPAKELTAATNVMQISSNELDSLVSGEAKCEKKKKTKFTT